MYNYHTVSRHLTNTVMSFIPKHRSSPVLVHISTQNSLCIHSLPSLSLAYIYRISHEQNTKHPEFLVFVQWKFSYGDHGLHKCTTHIHMGTKCNSSPKVMYEWTWVNATLKDCLSGLFLQSLPKFHMKSKPTKLHNLRNMKIFVS